MQVREQLPNRIRELRKKHGIGLTALAAEINRDSATLQRYETGETSIPDEIKLHLADRFGVTVAYLMAWRDS